MALSGTSDALLLKAYPIVEAKGVDDYDWTAFLMIHAVFFFPLLLITMANGGKLVKAGKEEGSKK